MADSLWKWNTSCSNSKGLPKLNVPEFHGVLGDEVEERVRIFDLNCNAARIALEERGVLAVIYFRGNALTWTKAGPARTEAWTWRP